MINKKNKSMNMSKKDKLKRSFNRKRICLLIKDFLDFDKLYKDLKIEILEKHTESKLLSEDLASIFQ